MRIRIYDCEDNIAKFELDGFNLRAPIRYVDNEIDADYFWKELMKANNFDELLDALLDDDTTVEEGIVICARLEEYVKSSVIPLIKKKLLNQ